MDDLSGTECEFVILGGGAVGCGVAYSLAQAGKTDVLVLERSEQLGAITTSQGAGLCGQMRDSAARTQLAMHSAETFRNLQANAATKPDWNEVGSLRIALTEEAVAQFEQLAIVSDACGLTHEMIDVAEAARRWSVMDFSQALAVLWCPGDGYLAPTSLVNSYCGEGERLGVRFSKATAVEGIVLEQGEVSGVRTSRGQVGCRYLINAAGAHAYHIARLAGLELPIVPVRHEYFVTVALAGLDPSFPCFRIPDLTLYGRVAGGGLLLGGWETKALHADPRGYAIEQGAPAIDPDWEVLGGFAEKMAALFPSSVSAAKSRVGQGVAHLYPRWPIHHR